MEMGRAEPVNKQVLRAKRPRAKEDCDVSSATGSSDDQEAGGLADLYASVAPLPSDVTVMAPWVAWNRNVCFERAPVRAPSELVLEQMTNAISDFVVNSKPTEVNLLHFDRMLDAFNNNACLFLQRHVPESVEPAEEWDNSGAPWTHATGRSPLHNMCKDDSDLFLKAFMKNKRVRRFAKYSDVPDGNFFHCFIVQHPVVAWFHLDITWSLRDNLGNNALHHLFARECRPMDEVAYNRATKVSGTLLIDRNNKGQTVLDVLCGQLLVEGPHTRRTLGNFYSEWWTESMFGVVPPKIVIYRDFMQAQLLLDLAATHGFVGLAKHCARSIPDVFCELVDHVRTLNDTFDAYRPVDQGQLARAVQCSNVFEVTQPTIVSALCNAAAPAVSESKGMDSPTTHLQSCMRHGHLDAFMAFAPHACMQKLHGKDLTSAMWNAIKVDCGHGVSMLHQLFERLTEQRLSFADECGAGVLPRHTVEPDANIAMQLIADVEAMRRVYPDNIFAMLILWCIGCFKWQYQSALRLFSKHRATKHLVDKVSHLYCDDAN